ncbi:hypothetical protein Neosp_012448 [[Neocosmospora] mangrovei]
MADLSRCLPLTRESVFKAHELIKPLIHETPVLTNKTLNQMASTPRELPENVRPAQPLIRLWFKCENMQRMGAFKARGAFHAIERLKQDPEWIAEGGMKKGVALALAAQESGIPAYIVMPDVTRPNKIAATKGYGANVTLCERFGREAAAAKITAETGARLVPPFNHPDVMLGAGTAGLELQHQVEKLGSALDAIIAPCSGGGLLSGTALSCEGTPISVFGCEPEFEGADDARRGFIKGERITEVKTSTIADGLIGVVGPLPWSVIYERKLVKAMYAVTEDQILEATRLVLERMKLFIEPSAAVPLAAVLFNEEFRAMVEREAGENGWDVGIILSGGNVSAEGLAKLFTP